MQLGSLQQQASCRLRSCSSSRRPRGGVSFRHHPGRLAVRASAESAAALSQPSDSSSSSRRGTTSSSGLPGAAADAVYLKAPLPGGALAYPDRSVVVLGDVPPGARAAAKGSGAQRSNPLPLLTLCLPLHTTTTFATTT
jgi:hypothetical protein